MSVFLRRSTPLHRLGGFSKDDGGLLFLFVSCLVSLGNAVPVGEGGEGRKGGGERGKKNKRESYYNGIECHLQPQR